MLNEHDRSRLAELEMRCKQLEKDFRLSEDRFNKLFRASSNLMTITTVKDGRIIDINEAGASLGGYRREELIGQISADIGLFADAMQRETLVRKLHEDGRVHNLEMKARTKTGELRTVLLSADPITLKDEECLLGISIDITEHKQADESLRQTLAWQEALFEGSRDGILISDENSNIVSANAAACNLTGYSKQELLKMRAADLQIDADLPKLANLHKRILVGEDVQAETIITTKDGRNIDVEFGHKRVLISGVPYVHTIARDVSSRKLLEAQLLQAQKMEAIGALAGGVAHDFNNLLSVIKGYTELLLDEFDQNDPRRQDLEQIEKASQRAVSLTSQLLAFSRKQILQPEILDLSSAIADMSTMLRRLIGEDIELSTFAEPNLGLISADPGQIQQIVMNLAVNARDAMPQGGKLIIEAANVDLDERSVRTRPMMGKGHYVLLAISDNGTGMDSATRSRIFEPFFTTKEKGRGTGLGLSTVYGIVKQSNGFIWVYSEPGKGTTFKIYFPRVGGETNKAAGAGKLRHESGGSETVLLVEDEKSVRALAGMILRKRGYNVLQAGDGVEALRVARDFNGDIDLVLTDVVMPGMSGRTLVARLESVRPGIKSLYMSGYTDNAIVDHGILDSKVAFLPKPFTVQSLTHKVREVINSK